MAFKLTLDEGLALYNVVQDKVGLAPVLAAVSAALGPNRAQAFVGSMGKLRLTNKEKIALVLGLAKLAPGATTKDKMLWLLKNARSCFDSDARFKEAMAAVAAELNKLANAADDPPFVADDFLRFYGRVNMWAAAGEDELRKDIAVCKECRVGYHIEMAGWRSGETAFDGEEKLSAVIAMYRKLLSWCREAKIPLFTSITNRNVEITKYSNVGRPFASIVPAAKRLAQAVFDEGPEWQFVQPVAETNNGNKPVEDFEKWCGTLFAGWPLVYNGNGGRPLKPAYGWSDFGYHPNKGSDSVPAGCIAVTDTGSIIRESTTDGQLDGPGNPSWISSWFAKCKASKAKGAAYYAFTRVKHDPAAIRACAAPAGSSEQPAAGNWPAELSDVTWLHTNVRAWPATTTVVPAIGGGKIRMPFDKTGVWPSVGSNDGQVNANPWAIVKRDGKWYAGTWEWLRPNDPNKPMSCLDRSNGAGDHFKVSPLNSWVAKSGEEFYIMVSGPARDAKRGAKERSDPVKVVWP